jgi:hypothetical protein
VKNHNQYSLENYFKILEIKTGRKNPCDIMEFLEGVYYSQSKGTEIPYKQMDITHLIRVLRNKAEDNEEILAENGRLQNEIEKIKKQITKVLED